MRYELFLKFFSSDYPFLDQASQSKKVLNLIWHKHGSKVGPLMMVRAVNNWLLIRPGATQRRRKFPSLNFFSPLRHLSLAWSLFFIFLSEAKIRHKKNLDQRFFSMLMFYWRRDLLYHLLYLSRLTNFKRIDFEGFCEFQVAGILKRIT
jgi:hypothetical protein